MRVCCEFTVCVTVALGVCVCLCVQGLVCERVFGRAHVFGMRVKFKKAATVPVHPRASPRAWHRAAGLWGVVCCGGQPSVPTREHSCVQ